MFALKVFIGAIVCVVLFAKIDAQRPDPVRIKQDIDDCIIEKQVDNEDDIKRLNNRQTPETEKGKCALACVFEKNGLIQNKKFVPGKLPNGQSKDCDISPTITDICALAVNISNCISQQMG